MSTKESLPSTPILETNPCETIDLGTRDDRHFQDEPETLGLWTERLAIQKQLEEAQEELRDVKARLVALQNTVEVLQDDKEKLVREKRVLREENDQLKEDINNYRSNRSKATTEISSIAQPPVPKEKSRRDDIKVRRSESKRRGEDTDRDTLKRRKESERLHEEDKKRIYARFDHHDSKSYDSGIGSTSGSSRRSHIERDSSTAPRSSAESPRRMRADSSYSQIRPQVVATTKYRDHEGSTVFYDDTYAEAGGKYHAYPLASPVQWRERRRRDSPHAGADGDYRPDPYPLASPVPWRGRRRRDSPHAGAHGDYLPYPLASPATKPETQSATALADICLRKFGDCCSQRALEANHWIENRQADFNLWISRMIEFRDLVGGNSSSEFGLDTRPRELSLVKNLLTNLGSHLSNCEATSEGDFLKESKQNVDSAIQNLALLAIAIRQTANYEFYRIGYRQNPATVIEREELSLASSTKYFTSTRIPAIATYYIP
ncbi:hypothetical protein CcaCcLH18_03951 [Colletotrichum camelliae]|nr:hypothetical protein CcaCcLH18_03951 [Colletotrichum camelliae]